MPSPRRSTREPQLLARRRGRGTASPPARGRPRVRRAHGDRRAAGVAARAAGFSGGRRDGLRGARRDAGRRSHPPEHAGQPQHHPEPGRGAARLRQGDDRLQAREARPARVRGRPELGITKMVSGTISAAGADVALEVRVVDVGSGFLDASILRARPRTQLIELQNEVATRDPEEPQGAALASRAWKSCSRIVATRRSTTTTASTTPSATPSRRRSAPPRRHPAARRSSAATSPGPTRRIGTRARYPCAPGGLPRGLRGAGRRSPGVAPGGDDGRASGPRSVGTSRMRATSPSSSSTSRSPSKATRPSRPIAGSTRSRTPGAGRRCAWRSGSAPSSPAGRDLEDPQSQVAEHRDAQRHADSGRRTRFGSRPRRWL